MSFLTLIAWTGSFFPSAKQILIQAFCLVLIVILDSSLVVVISLEANMTHTKSMPLSLTPKECNCYKICKIPPTNVRTTIIFSRLIWFIYWTWCFDTSYPSRIPIRASWVLMPPSTSYLISNSSKFFYISRKIENWTPSLFVLTPRGHECFLMSRAESIKGVYHVNMTS